MRRRNRLLLLAATMIAIPAGRVSAWQPIASSRPTWQGAAPYSVHEAGSEDLGGFAATESIVREAFEDWTRVACTSLTTSYAGGTASRPLESGSRGVVGWVESNWHDSSGVIGQTRSTFNSTGIVNATMALNGVHFTWTTDPGSGSRVNAYSILLHEAGHYFGLGHSRHRDAAMYGSYSGGVVAITEDDREGICALYPSDGTSGGDGDDCSTSGCPSGYACSGGTCVAEPDDGGLGVCEPCTSDAQCGRLADKCLRYPDGHAYCGMACASDADCDGDRCQVVSDGTRQCVRRDADGEATCGGGSASAPEPAPEPEPDPASDPEPDPEPDSEPAPGASSPAPDAGTAGSSQPEPSLPPRSDPPAPLPGGLGARCETGADCESRICVEGSEGARCTVTCDAPEGCPSGYECVPGGVIDYCAAQGAAASCSQCGDRRLEGSACSVVGAGGGVGGAEGAALLAFLAVVLGWRRRGLLPSP